MENQAIRPSEAARRLGVAPNTLRVYSSRFSSLLSSTAGAPRASRSGGAAHRLYSPSDLEILDEAKGLLSTGLTYEQALSKLTARIVGKEDAVARRRSGQFSRENPDLPDLRTLQDALDAWRSLAEERGREVAELRERIRDLESQLSPKGAGRVEGGKNAGQVRASKSEWRRSQRNAQAGWLSRLFATSAGDTSEL